MAKPKPKKDENLIQARISDLEAIAIDDLAARIPLSKTDAIRIAFAALAERVGYEWPAEFLILKNWPVSPKIQHQPLGTNIAGQS